MKIFGQADKPKKYQETLKAEASRVEMAREKALKQYEKTEQEIKELIEKDRQEFEELESRHIAELKAIELRKATVEHQIKEASSGFKATQARLNTLEGSLKARERAVELAERAAQERVADSHRLEQQTKTLVKERNAELLYAKEFCARRVKETEEGWAEVARISKQSETEAANAAKAFAYAEKLMADANMQMSRVRALEDNLELREQELARKAKKLASKEASLMAAQKEYEPNRR